MMHQHTIHIKNLVRAVHKIFNYLLAIQIIKLVFFTVSSEDKHG